MSNVVTPLMGLIEPGVGTEVSPTWATDLNQNFAILDGHTHAPGSGNQITPQGININTDLSFLGNNAILLRSARYSPQGSPLALGTDLNCTYVSGVDLYYNDGNGNQIRITQSGGVAGSPGSISNLTSPASAAWVSATSTFVWQADSGIAANMDVGTLVIRYPGSYPSPSGNFIALEAPSSLASGYALTLPALPASNSFMQLTTGGAISASIALSKGITASNIADATITGTQIASATIQGTNIASNTVTRANQVAVGQQVSSSCGAFSTTSATATDITNLSVTITTSGRPVMLLLVGDGNLSLTHPAMLESFNSSGTTAESQVSFERSGTEIGRYQLRAGIGGATSAEVAVPSSSMQMFDAPGAGTYTYKARGKVTVAGTQLTVQYSKLVAYEL